MFLQYSIFDFPNIDLRSPDPPAIVIAKQAMIAFHGWLATSSPYLWATKSVCGPKKYQWAIKSKNFLIGQKIDYFYKTDENNCGLI